jgi:hypothetical protein
MSWTRQRVPILAMVIFVAHVIAIFALHTPTPMLALPEAFRSPRMPTPQMTTNNLLEAEELNDPLVFAGAHQHGFSAAAWMMRPKQEYVLTNSAPAPRFLSFVRPPTEFPAVENLAEASRSSDLPFVEFALPKEMPKSTLAVQGALEQRRVMSAPEIPTQFATDVLSNTVVQVGVRADGFPFSTRVISGSGSRAADLQALDIANRVRFAPSMPVSVQKRNAAEAIGDPGELQWGEFVFQWFTTEPIVTNGLPKTEVSAAK